MAIWDEGYDIEHLETRVSHDIEDDIIITRTKDVNHDMTVKPPTKLQKNERAYSTEIQGLTMLRGLNLGQDYHYRNAYRRGINENQWEH